MQWHELLRIYVVISNNVVLKANTRNYLLGIDFYFGVIRLNIG